VTVSTEVRPLRAMIIVLAVPIALVVAHRLIAR
jgi:hypothetical protein